MRSRSSVPVLRGISIAFLSIAIVITIVALIGYSRTRNNYPNGMTIGGVPVGGVNPQIASERVLQVYSSPIEVQYGDAIIQIDPSVVGFELDMDSMIAAADLARTGGSFWGGFWDYLWNREPDAVEIPLSASVPEEASPISADGSESMRNWRSPARNSAWSSAISTRVIAACLRSGFARSLGMTTGLFIQRPQRAAQHCGALIVFSNSVSICRRSSYRGAPGA